ncbi:MAG: spore coat biosynthesis protein F, partial [Leptospira sp.]|nr:spore coat biosynthesis protein F [Leptospira sp.]
MNGIPSTPEIFAFVQARTGSTRLRGKIFRHIPEGSDTTLLDHIAKRLGRILPADRVIFLVPENDIEAIEFCKSRKYNWFEGPEEDVRERYILAAKAHNAETIIRLTGDNPFIDILHAELLIESFFNTDVDIASFYGLPIGMGLEIFKRSSLLTEPETGLEARHREHVSLHLKENPEKFRFLKLKPVLTETEILGSEKIRLTIDEIKDFYLAETIFQELGTKNFFFGAKEVISLLGKNSGIFSLNEDVKQIAYPLKNRAYRIKNRIFIQYANPEQSGTGH